MWTRQPTKKKRSKTKKERNTVTLIGSGVLLANALGGRRVIKAPGPLEALNRVCGSASGGWLATPGTHIGETLP